MESTQFYLQEFLNIVLKRKRLIILFLALVLSVVTLSTLRQKKIYEARTTVEVGAETPNISFYKEVVSDTPQNWWSIQTYYETQYKILKSRHLMGLVADKLLEKNIVSGTRDGLIGWLQGAVGVEPVDKSRLVVVSMQDTNPKRAAMISDLVVDTYAEDNLNKKIRGAQEAVEMLSRQMDIFRAEKQKSDSELQQFKEKHNIVQIGDKPNIVKQGLASLNQTLNDTKNKRIMTEARYRALKRIVGRSENTEELIGAVNSELMASLKTEYDQLARQYAELSKRYKSKHPTILSLEAKMEAVSKSVKREAKAELSKLKTAYLLEKAQEDSIRRNLDKQKKEALKVDSLNLEMETVKSIQATNREFYEGLTKKLKEADLTGLIKSNNIRVLDRAVVPTSPVKPNLMMNLIMAFVLGLAGGIGIAYLLESMDNTVKSEEDVKHYAQTSLLGVIPAQSIKEGEQIDHPVELLTAKDPSSSISEIYKTLRTNISFISSTNKYKTFQVTSPGAKDGKTTTAINLAVSMAQAGSPTIIVDLDLRKSRISSVFDIKRETGMSDYLIGQTPLDDCIKKSGIKDLDLITTGVIPPNPAEIMGSELLKEALDKLKERYKYVIVDSTPIAPVTDSLILAQIVDAVIMVVGADRTGKYLLKGSRDQLIKVNANIIGAVYNGVNVEKKKYLSKYYNYGYYKAGYYYGEEKEDKKQKRVDA